MPFFTPLQLEELSARIFGAAGAPPDVAAYVARSLVLSNLTGHDSHGVLRIPWYLESVEKGTIEPAARPTIGRETPTTAVVDGNWAFGQVTAAFATRVAIEKARAAQVSAVAMIRCNHIGRLGEFTEMAALKGMVAFLAGSNLGGRGTAAPYGGAERILGPNPLSFAVPAAGDAPVVADMATTLVAEGKLRVARAKKEQVVPGAIVDRDGNPTVDPEDFYAGGMMLTMAGHKGSALSVAVDLLSRHVTGAELFGKDETTFCNLLVVINVEAFRPLAELQEVVSERLRQIKGVRPAPGFSEVLIPGEPERLNLAQRSEEGIDLPQDTWKALSAIAARLHVPLPEPVRQ